MRRMFANLDKDREMALARELGLARQMGLKLTISL
jgi:hypothetical protein